MKPYKLSPAKAFSAAVNMVDRDMLRRVYGEFGRRLGIVCAAQGGHIEYI